jgi:hypothetical protein
MLFDDMIWYQLGRTSQDILCAASLELEFRLHLTQFRIFLWLTFICPQRYASVAQNAPRSCNNAKE